MAENSERNTYCERLRLPVPRLEDVVGQHRIRLFHLMLVALLEHGGPVGLDDLAGRLRTAGVVARAVTSRFPCRERGTAWNRYIGTHRAALD